MNVEIKPQSLLNISGMKIQPDATKNDRAKVAADEANGKPVHLVPYVGLRPNNEPDKLLLV